MEWVGAHSSPTSTPGDFGLILLTAAFTGVNEWLLTPGEAQDFFDEPTLVRQLISFTVMPLAVVSPSVTAQYPCGWMGILVTGGDAAVPDPSIQANRADYDWAWWTPYILGSASSGATVSAIGFPNAAAPDIRSKRKILNGMGLAFYMTPSGLNNADIQFAFQWRGLFQNH